MGPNDAFRVVWAISEFFLMIIVFIISTNHLTGIDDILKLRMHLRGDTTRRTGPNDAKRVVWAISEFFLCFIYIYLLTD